MTCKKNGYLYEHNKVKKDRVFIWRLEKSLSLHSMNGVIRLETRLHGQHCAVLEKTKSLDIVASKAHLIGFYCGF